jgi:hypothetical protein
MLRNLASLARQAGLEPSTPGLEEQWWMLEPLMGQRVAELPTRTTHAIVRDEIAPRPLPRCMRGLRFGCVLYDSCR